MRCKSCDYPLWNLPTRACPECGTPFKPSDFEFVPDSVRFCCPQCAQDYYGTGEKGHLVPPAFTCVRCSNPIEMDQMILQPTTGISEAQTRADVLPWLDRHGRGFFSRLFGTIGWALFSPGRLARAMPPPDDARAWRFAMLVGLLYFLVGGGIFLLPLFLIGVFAPGRGGGGLVAAGLSLLVLLLVPVFAAVGIAVWSLVSHAILRMTGATQFGLGRTAACMCYASAANVLIAIPCLGGYAAPISWIWWAISASIMLMVGQKVAGWRAALSTVLPPLMVVAAFVLWIVLWFVPMVNQTTQSMAPMISAARDEMATARVASSIRSYAAMNNDRTPPHALSLIVDGQLTLAELTDGPGTSSPALSGGDAWISAQQIAGLSPSRQAEAVEAAIAGMDAGAASHRLGDFDFVYPGIDVSMNSTADGGLWLVIKRPRDPSDPLAPLSPTLCVASLDGSTKTIPIEQWPAALASQNELRAKGGLPPIPDPLGAAPDPPDIPTDAPEDPPAEDPAP